MAINPSGNTNNIRKYTPDVLFLTLSIFLSLSRFTYYNCPRMNNTRHAGKGLTQLDVSQNQLQNVPSSALKNLHHLLILNLNHNKISVIHNRAFEGLDTLEILTLYENKISVIEPEAFRGLDKWVFIIFSSTCVRATL